MMDFGLVIGIKPWKFPWRDTFLYRQRSVYLSGVSSLADRLISKNLTVDDREMSPSKPMERKKKSVRPFIPCEMSNKRAKWWSVGLRMSWEAFSEKDDRTISQFLSKIVSHEFEITQTITLFVILD
jgi:hypothetical protein